MALGRPTIYNDDVLTKTREYIDSCEDGYTVIERPSVKDGKLMGNESHRVFKVRIPTIEGLAIYLKINKDTVQEWKKHEEFSVLISELLAKQATMLVSNSLSGDYNPMIAKALLAKHGYRDAIDTDITSKGEKVSMNPVTDGIAQEYEQKLKDSLTK